MFLIVNEFDMKDREKKMCDMFRALDFWKDQQKKIFRLNELNGKNLRDIKNA